MYRRRPAGPRRGAPAGGVLAHRFANPSLCSRSQAGLLRQIGAGFLGGCGVSGRCAPKVRSCLRQSRCQRPVSRRRRRGGGAHRRVCRRDGRCTGSRAHDHHDERSHHHHRRSMHGGWSAVRRACLRNLRQLLPRLHPHCGMHAADVLAGFVQLHRHGKRGVRDLPSDVHAAVSYCSGSHLQCARSVIPAGTKSLR